MVLLIILIIVVIIVVYAMKGRNYGQEGAMYRSDTNKENAPQLSDGLRLCDDCSSSVFDDVGKLDGVHSP